MRPFKSTVSWVTLIHLMSLSSTLSFGSFAPPRTTITLQELFNPRLNIFVTRQSVACEEPT